MNVGELERGDHDSSNDDEPAGELTSEWGLLLLEIMAYF
jgi:hypothetical protein